MPSAAAIASPVPLARVRFSSSWSPTRLVSFGFGALALLFLAAIFFLFLWQSIPVWKHEGAEYVAGKRWFFRTQEFGMLPMVYGTCVVGGIAVLLAAPLGLGAAIFTSEYLSGRLRFGVKVVVELLAGVPSVVYGLLGLLFLRAWIYRALTPFDPLSGDTLLTAGVLLAVMVLPTIMTLSDDALRGVPAAQREAARGLGLNRAETALFVSLPQARSGILGAVLLGFGRAVGETIAVFLVVGRQDNQWPANFFSLRPWIEAGQTLTTKLGSAEANIAYADKLHWAAIAGLGLALLAIVAVVTFAGAWLEERSKTRA